MSRRMCILGNKCPQKMVSKNILSIMSEDGRDPEQAGSSEMCFFCGEADQKKKKLKNTKINPWQPLILNTETIKTKSSANVDSLSCWKNKKKDVRIEELRLSLPIFKKEPSTPSPSVTEAADEFEDGLDNFELTEISFESINNVLGEGSVPSSSSSDNSQLGTEERDIKPIANGCDSGFWDTTTTNITPKTKMDSYIPVPSTSKQADSPSFCAQVPKAEVIALSKPPKENLGLLNVEVEHLIYKSFQSTEEISSSTDGETEDDENGMPKKRNKRKRKQQNNGEHIGSGFDKWKKRKRINISPNSDHNYSEQEISHNISWDDHDYIGKDLGLMAMMEQNADTIALETDNMHWQDIITLSDSPVSPELIDLEDNANLKLLADSSKKSPILVDSDSESHSQILTITNSEHNYGQTQETDIPSDETIDYSCPPPIFNIPLILNDELPEVEIIAPPVPPKTHWECPICLEPDIGQDRAAPKKCGHVFCKDCIEAYIATGTHKCPTCRAKVTLKQLLVLRF